MGLREVSLIRSGTAHTQVVPTTEENLSSLPSPASVKGSELPDMRSVSWGGKADKVISLSTGRKGKMLPSLLSKDSSEGSSTVQN